MVNLIINKRGVKRKINVRPKSLADNLLMIRK